MTTLKDASSAKEQLIDEIISLVESIKVSRGKAKTLKKEVLEKMYEMEEVVD